MVLFFPPPPDSSSSEDDDDDVVEPVKVTNHALKKIIVQLSHRLAGTGHTMGLDAFRGVVGDCGYLLPASTLQRWRKSIKKDPTFFDSPVSHGRWPSLTSDEEAMLVGWILHEGAMKRQVTYAGCQEFLDQQFGIKLTQPTLAAYLHANFISNLVAKVRPTAQAYTDAQALDLGFEFIQELKTARSYMQPPANVC